MELSAYVCTYLHTKVFVFMAKYIFVRGGAAHAPESRALHWASRAALISDSLDTSGAAVYLQVGDDDFVVNLILFIIFF